MLERLTKTRSTMPFSSGASHICHWSRLRLKIVEGFSWTVSPWRRGGAVQKRDPSGVPIL